MSESDYRAALWRYTEVSNALMALSMAATGVKLADSAISYLYKSDYSFKPVSTKLSTVDRMGANVAKALNEAPEMAKHLGAREATFTLSTQWKPTGYFFGGPDIVSWSRGTSYSSRINVKLRFEVMQYTFTLEGKKDKDKDKDKGPLIEYDKLSTAITTALKNTSSEDTSEQHQIIKLEPEVPAKDKDKEKDKKPPITITVLENASMALGEGKPRQVGWGTKLNLTGEILVGRDGDALDTIYYEFKIIWSEGSTSATFNDTISIKCYHSGKVEVSEGFYQACETVDDVKQRLSVNAETYKVLVDDDVPEFANLDDSEGEDLVLNQKKDKGKDILILPGDDQVSLNVDAESSSDDEPDFTLIPSSDTDKTVKTVKLDQPEKVGEPTNVGEKTPLLQEKKKD